MKKTIIIAASLLTFISCTKSNNNNGSSNNTSSSNPNTVVVADNGTNYTENGGGTSTPGATSNILCTLSKQTTASSLSLIVEGSTYPVQIELTLNEVGPVAGTGIYTLADTLTSYSNSYQGTVSETFSGGQTYNIDTTYVNVTTASNNTVIGTFRLHVTNAAGGKVITGNINCKAATVN